MKVQLKYKLLAAVITVMTVAACTDDFEETNTNPNQPADVPATYLLTYAQELILDRLYDGFDNSRVGMTLAQYWSQNQYTDESRYLYRTATNNTSWNGYYLGLFNLQEIIRLNEENEATKNDNQIAIARIMKAWVFQLLTDIYGDIPYVDALKSLEGNVAPSYTPQAEIYTDLLKELTEASAQIDVAAPGFTSGDLIYAGNMTNWKKFANSLKLRVAIRAVDVLGNTALQAIEEAYTVGVFTSNDENATIKYLAAQPNTNPLYVDVVVGGRIDYSASDVLLDQLLDSGDPRLSAYYEPAETSGTFVGRPFGQNAANANAQNADDVSQLSAQVLAPDFPGKILDYAEVSFTLAEAAQRGASVGNTAEEYYAQGIAASMNDWGVGTETEIATYIANNPYDAGNFKQSIGVQKWIALYMQGYQGWIEWRRLDFTGLLKMPVDGPLIDINQIPVRYVYPPDEQTLNRTSYDAAVQRMGADNFTTKVWWDVN